MTDDEGTVTGAVRLAALPSYVPRAVDHGPDTDQRSPGSKVQPDPAAAPNVTVRRTGESPITTAWPPVSPYGSGELIR